MRIQSWQIGAAIAASFLFLIFASGCSGDDQACTPGASVACSCPNGNDGAQTCNEDGTFDACQCDSDDTESHPDTGVPEDAAQSEPDTGQPEPDAEQPEPDAEQPEPDAEQPECQSGSDCDSGICDADAGECLEARCDDGVLNGEETDVDCGGPDCPPCETEMLCVLDTDCLSDICDDEQCVECVETADCGDNQTCEDIYCICSDERSDEVICTEESAACGAVIDVCGETVECGDCDGGDICEDNACVEPPECQSSADCNESDHVCDAGHCVCQESRTDEAICDDEGAQCGSVHDVCGEIVECSPCDGCQECDDSQCVDVDDNCTGCEQCDDGNCIDDDDQCTDPDICEGATCTCDEPRSDEEVCDDEGAECGTVTDVCGNAVDCGDICFNDGTCSDGGDPIECTTGETCFCSSDECCFSCPDGNCDFDCGSGSTCEVSCAGGNCGFDCGGGSTCDFTCSGGNCSENCGGQSTCSQTCSSGCDVLCGSTSTCSQVCEEPATCSCLNCG